MLKNIPLLIALSVLVAVVVLGVWQVRQLKLTQTPSDSDQKTAVTEKASQEPPMISKKADLTPDEKGFSKSTAVIKTAKGLIKIKFFPTDAPNTTSRIAELVQSGFYNGLTFHRVENWVIQGGDPTGTGTGGSGQKLKAEFNRRKHMEGTVGMARSMDPDSADSQFYITFGPQPHLDNNYTVFGQVIEGMDVVKGIQKGDTIQSFNFE